MVVQVLTERNDTLDLMRRNIDELGRALSDLGYENLSFAFGQGGGGENTNQTGDHMTDLRRLALELEEDEMTSADSLLTASNTLAFAPDSIDIRL